MVLIGNETLDVTVICFTSNQWQQHQNLNIFFLCSGRKWNSSNEIIWLVFVFGTGVTQEEKIHFEMCLYCFVYPCVRVKSIAVSLMVISFSKWDICYRNNRWSKTSKWSSFAHESRFIFHGDLVFTLWNVCCGPGGALPSLKSQDNPLMMLSESI